MLRPVVVNTPRPGVVTKDVILDFTGKVWEFTNCNGIIVVIYESIAVL